MDKFLAALASLFTFAAIAHAAPIDVPSDAWYSTTVSEFGRAGYFDETQPFRPTQKATRAEFVQLVVKLQGGVKHAPFTTQSFDDVSPNNPFFNYFEEAGLAGWLKGTGSCYGTHPCTASPDSPINRAEAATLMIRAFNLQMREKVPTFTDNPTGLWYTVPINSAASLCILQGDAGGNNVRPADSMIRAEMVTMLERVLQDLGYPNCTPKANFSLPKLNTVLPSESSSASSQSSSQTYSSSTSTVVPEYSSSSSSDVRDVQFTLALNSYIAKAEFNIGAMTSTASSWAQSPSQSVAASSMQSMVFSYTGLLSQLKFFAKESETKILTKSELSQVTSIEQQMNGIVSTYNMLVDSWKGK